MDEIAARTRTTKRMIYYYFGGKEQLYIAVLERAYARIRSAEQRSTSTTSTRRAAIRRLAELTFDHHESHPDFIRLVSIENIHHAEHMRQVAERSRNLNTPAIELIERILDARARGRRCSAATSTPIDVHMMISSFCVFRVANRHTFGALFGRDLTDPGARDHYRRDARRHGRRLPGARLAGVGEPVALRPQRRLRAVGDAEGLEDAAHVVLDRLLGDVQPPGDQLVRPPCARSARISRSRGVACSAAPSGRRAAARGPAIGDQLGGGLGRQRRLAPAAARMPRSSSSGSASLSR